MPSPRLIAAIAVAALASGGCTADSQRKPDPRETSQGQGSGKVQAENGAGDNAGSDSMSPGFDRAHAAFRDHAAKVLGVAAGDVQVGPAYEKAGDEFEHSVGKVWGFRGFRKDDPQKAVQGWAVADGTVVTPERNLGLLFDAAGVWSDSPGLDAGALAARIVWGMGMNHRVIIDLGIKAGAPALNMAGDGTGTLAFSVARRQAGPGGAGGGPEEIADATVTLTADHKAELKLSRWTYR